MNVPYPRPTKLSDPYHDFWPEFGTELLATPDHELKWYQLKQILGPFLPAGTYEESIYFLPLAFKRLRYDEENALDLTTSVIWFVSEYADKLERDSLLCECRQAINDCLQEWTQGFTVIHCDRSECAAKGWTIPHLDCAPRSEDICRTLCDLDRFERHADLADAFISQLALSPQPVDCAWFLELVRAQTDVYPPPTREVFSKFFADTILIAQKRRMVEESSLIAVASPTYWLDVFEGTEPRP